MSVQLCTLLLNEEEWIESSYTQHMNWPGLKRWVFVHGADVEYGKASPDMVTKDGLSIDRTAQILDQIQSQDSRITVIHHGWMGSDDKAQCKVVGRSRYIDVARDVAPDFLICLDQDEFYTHADQQRVIDLMARDSKVYAWTFPKREIWRPPSIADQPLFQYEVKGGFWDIPCCHWWRWCPDLRYSNVDHNIPVRGAGTSLRKDMRCYHKFNNAPELIHLGFSASEKTRQAKIRYYADRGEATDPKRQWYVESRAMWKDWKPGDVLPKGANVVPFSGVIPEVFR